MTGVTAKYDAVQLREMIQAHFDATGSQRAKTILEHWEETLPLFKKITPNDYSRMLSAISKLEEKGIPRRQAELEAFYNIQKGGA